MEQMMEKKMNWGTLVIGIVIGLVVMWVIQVATKPGTTAGVSDVALCDSNLRGDVTFINNAENTGKVARRGLSGEITSDEYPFRIPDDLVLTSPPQTILVGLSVTFDTVGIGNDCSSRKATHLQRDL